MTLNRFIDPRTMPRPDRASVHAEATDEPDRLVGLHQLCREGRLYEVEDWIKAGRPFQVREGTPIKTRRYASALEIALQQGYHALVHLLLCNGYDPNGEDQSPLDQALRSRRFDLVDLLLEWGTDPRQMEPEDLFGTYRSDLFERFLEMGVDLTHGHAMAEHLAYHTSNKPLFGFAKRHRQDDPKVQTELNIALAHQAGRGNEKGVALCLWAGADPHAPAPSLQYCYEDDEEEIDEDSRFPGFSAIHEACRYGNVDILERLNPDSSLDDFEELYSVAENSAVIDSLARLALPKDMGRLIQNHLWWARAGIREWRSIYILRSLFDTGARWDDYCPAEIANLRRLVLKLSDRTFIDLMKLLTAGDHCSPEILRELARTPAMHRRMHEVGFLPTSGKGPWRQDRPTGFRVVLKKCGIELPKPPKRPLPRCVTIGPRRHQARKVQLRREELYERVWSQPVQSVAEEWGLSDRGLSKACRRLSIPVPPRGYWAKVQAGKRTRRKKLPPLPEGEAEEIVIWAPE